MFSDVPGRVAKKTLLDWRFAGTRRRGRARTARSDSRNSPNWLSRETVNKSLAGLFPRMDQLEGRAVTLDLVA